MRKSGRHIASALALLLVASIAAPPAAAQSGSPLFKPEELEQIVAPIALFPDPLLAQVMMAATYPLEIVQAARFAKANPSLQGDPLNEALRQQAWDDSVKSLVAFPQVLTMLNDKLDWTQKLGDAVLGQQADVMAAVQRLRVKAQSEGNLQTTAQQTVSAAPAQAAAGAPQQTIITIEPANPEVVYVPTYNPATIYGAWPYAAYPPYPVYAPGAALAAGAITFGAGMAVGAALWGGCDWGHGDVNINNTRYNNFSSNVNNAERRNQIQANRANVQGGNSWQHNPEHRRGTQYRDPATQQRFNRTGAPNPESREAFRGRAEQGRQELAAGGGAQGLRANQPAGHARAGQGAAEARAGHARPGARGRRDRSSPRGSRRRAGTCESAGGPGESWRRRRRVRRRRARARRPGAEQPRPGEPRSRPRIRGRRSCRGVSGRRWPRRGRRTGAMMMRTLVIAIALVIGTHAVSFAAAPGRRFESWDDAVNVLVSAIRAGDRKALVAILGPQARTLVSSGDDIADRQRFQQFVSAYDEKHWLEGGGGQVRLYVGEDDFPFPIPLVPDGPWWRWNVAAARDEMIGRRIGRNELNAMQACLAYVDAQRDYFAEDRDGNQLLEYAQRFRSRPGTRDGLYWETTPGAPLSPLGPLVAQARNEGYRARGTGATPYHGYLFRILTAQGPDAPDGAYDYVVNGHMIGGFALVAFPARYGDSGVMTFIVSHDGVIYQKNLGADTARVASAMASFNPDRSWNRVVFAAAER